MTKEFYNNDILPLVAQLMEHGKTPVQVAAALKISKQDFLDWLQSPDKKYDQLRQVVEKGLTACEAYWIAKGQEGVLGDIRYFRESTYKAFMQNSFGWSDKVEDKNTTVKTSEQLLSDQYLEEQIKTYLENLQNGKSGYTTNKTSD